MVVWRRGTVASNQGHIGFVLHANDGRVQTVEGNHTPKVAKFHYVIEDERAKPYTKRLIGFVRPGG